MDLWRPNSIGEQVMLEPYKQFVNENETERMIQARRLWDWYFNDRTQIHKMIRDAMAKIFPPPSTTLDKMNIRVMNIVRRVIRKVALMNARGIERMLDGGRIIEPQVNAGKIEAAGNIVKQSEDDKKYQAGLMGSTIGRKQREWKRLGILFNTVLVQPVWVYDTLSKTTPAFEPYMDFLIHTPAWCRVIPSEHNPLKPKALSYKIKMTLDGVEQNVTVVWTYDEHYLIDATGKKIPVQGSEVAGTEENKSMKNPFGVLPVAVYRIDEGGDFWGSGLWDLVDGNEEICIQLTNMFYTAVFQSHGERVAVNMGMTSPIKTGPDVTHVVENAGVAAQGGQQSQMYFINANAPLQVVRDLIDWFSDGIQKLKGLTPSSSQIDPNAITGIAKIMDAAEMAEDRAEQMNVDEDFEFDLFNIYRTVWNYWNPSKKISDTAVFSVEYTEPKPPSTVDEKIKEREAGLKNKWLSLLDIIMEDNQGMSREDAEKKLAEIITQNRRLKDVYGINELETSEPATAAGNENQNEPNQ